MFNFLFIFIRCFSLFVIGFVLSSKTNRRVLCFSFELSVFQLVLIKIESGFQMKNISSFWV